MNNLRTIRIVIAGIFFVACILFLFVEGGVIKLTECSERVQIIPSALAVSVGATLVWLIATFVFGRIYCSSVCPVGTLQDSSTWLRRKLKRVPAIANQRYPFSRIKVFAGFRYKHPAKWSGIILLFYVALLLLGLTGFAALIEPWNIMRLAARWFNPENVTPTKGVLFAGNVLMGTILGLLILGFIWSWALLQGRKFCTTVCPIGCVLGHISERALWKIEIDPDKCISCMKCEENCKSECIKVVSRYVDNSRCVRCFDCLYVCENEAIRFSRNRNRRATPLFQRRTEAGNV